jgi:hypothetical protein
VCADPYVIFDNSRCGRRRHFTLLEAMLVPIHDEQVLTQQAMAPNLDLLVCCNRYAVVDASDVDVSLSRAAGCHLLLLRSLNWNFRGHWLPGNSPRKTSSKNFRGGSSNNCFEF